MTNTEQLFSFSSSLTALLKLLSKPLRIRLVFLILLFLLSGAFEAFTIGAAMPFVQSIISPSSITHAHSYNLISEHFLVKSSLYQSAFVFSLLVILSAFLRITVLRLSAFYNARVGHHLSSSTYSTILSFPYQDYLDQSSAKLTNNLIVNVNVASGAVGLFLQFVISVIYIISLCLTLFIATPFLGLLSVSIYALFYLTVARLVRHRLGMAGHQELVNRDQIISLINDSVGNYRDVVINSTAQYFEKNYSFRDLHMRRLAARCSFLGSFPKQSIESIAIVAIIIYTLFSIQSNTQPDVLISQLAAASLISQRLLPSLQQTYGSWAGVKAASASIFSIVELTKQFPPTTRCTTKSSIHSSDQISELTTILPIKATNLSYKFPKSTQHLFSDVNLLIEEGQHICILGESGAGKSTLVDLLIGLLKPTNGAVHFGRQSLNVFENSSIIFPHLAHVPQDIYISNSSILENIAFGTDVDYIDDDRIALALETSCLTDVIKSRTNALNSLVGDRGRSLSGGQRQRIGIARSLYAKPSVLIFDEATSSLDHITAEKILTQIHSNYPHLTLIHITHNRDLTKYADKVYILENHKLFPHFST